MAYADVKSLPGRQLAVIAEIDFRACSLTHGVSPCTSTAAASDACFNSFASCLDQPNFTPTTKTFRFSNIRIDDVQTAGSAPTFPTLTGLSMSPTVLTPGQGLGIRSKVSITLQDHPYTDVGIDPYLTDRTYDPMDRGSLWSKMISRWPFYEGNTIRVKTGYLDSAGSYDATNFKTRTYVIDTVKGPNPKGQVQIVAKDPLKFADREKAQLPTQSQATLAADISSSTTSFSVTDPNNDIKTAFDAGQTYIRIDDEVMLLTGYSGASSPYTATVTRASIPSVYSGSVTAEEHSEDSTVQNCYFFNAQEVDDIVNYLLDDVAGVDATYLPTADWQAVVDFGLQNYTFSALITEPTGVNDLLNELTEHTIMLWWNERDQEVQMRSIIQLEQDYGPFDDTDHVIAESVSVARDDKARITQVWVPYSLRNPVLEMDELKNYSAVKVAVDLDAESANEYNQKKVKRIWSRWLHLDKGSVASEIANRLLRNYKDTKNIVTMDLDPKDDDAWTGDIVALATRQVQDQTGSTPERDYRVLEVSENFKGDSVRYSYTLQSIGGVSGVVASRYGLIGPNTLSDYTAETDANKSKYAFVAADDRGDGDPGFAPNEEPYLVI